ncbi:MAG: hypothetical protein LBI42_09835 [Chitinispirillales bacterium]|jgi:hypothetical protein|nr:hypothetical protein [Chitinispirillales bacterium]
MDKIGLLIIAFAMSILADVLHLNNDEEIRDAVIIEIGVNDIKFRIGERPVVYIIEKSDVAAISYADGTREELDSRLPRNRQSSRAVDPQDLIENKERMLEAQRRALEVERRALEEQRRMVERERMEAEADREVSELSNRAKPAGNAAGLSWFARGSLGWDKLTFDYDKNSPLSGINIGADVSFFFPVGDILGVKDNFIKFGFTAGFGYTGLSVSRERSSEGINYTEEIKHTDTDLSLSVLFRIGEKRRYVDAFYDISFPISTQSKAAAKIPGYAEQTVTYKHNPETGQSIGVFGRYDFIGIGFGKSLIDNVTFEVDVIRDNAVSTFIASGFLPISQTYEIIPSLRYRFGEYSTRIIYSIGLEYSF